MAAHGISNSGIIYIRFIGYGTNPPGGMHLVDDITTLSRSVQFDTDHYSTPEGQSVRLKVVRSGSTDAIETVAYATVAGDATEDVDYIAATGTVTFAVGDASETVNVQVNDDSVEEANETFRVRLSNPSPGLDLGAAAEATVTIEDDDSSEVFPFNIGFESGSLGPCWSTYTENDGFVEIKESDSSSGYEVAPMGDRCVWLDFSPSYGLAELTLQIDLSGLSNLTLSFLAYPGGGTDFILSDTYTGHADGKGVSVSTDGTTWYKLQGFTSTEWGAVVGFAPFTIDLDAAMAARGLSYGSNVRIRFSTYGNYFSDKIGLDDIRIFAPNFEFAARENSVLETDTASLEVLRKGNLAGAASVQYQTSDDTALAGSDYIATSGTLNFADGESVNTIHIPIVGDMTPEAWKTFHLTLSSPSSGYSIGVVNPAIVTIVDDDVSATLPVEEDFNQPLEAWWVPYGQADVAENEPQLLGDGLREAILTFDPQSKTNLYLNLKYKDMSWGNYLMPDTFAGHHPSDGVALSVDGTNWVKVLGLTYDEGPTEPLLTPM